MLFLDKRIKVILNQLRTYSITDGLVIPNWQYKKGQFFRPEEADASDTPWEDFTSDMSWYATYDGSDRFEGKFKGYTGDFRGIHGEHYWFRSRVTIPERMDGKAVYMRISTQISEWDDAKNPQFLVFINGQVVQGADMNHREIRLFDSALAGEEFTIDVQAYTGTMHMEFNFLCSLYVLNEAINHLCYDIEVPMMAFNRLGEDNKIRIDLLTVLNETVNLIDMREPESKAFYDSIDAAQAYITENLYEKMAGYDDIIATCVGHTHIDVAWW